MLDSFASRLEHLPVSLFAVPLGLSGWALLLLKLGEGSPWLRGPGLAAAALGLAVFVAVLIAYGLKILRHPRRVSEEFRHPVRMSFFPVAAKVLLVQSIVLLPLQREVSFGLWLAGTLLQTVLLFSIVSFWVRHQGFQIHHLNPAWFMPVVGAILVPVAGVEHAPAALNWWFFSVGLVLWIVLFTVVLNRLIFHPPLPERLAPTLFILFAPPAIGFISWVKLVPEAGPFAQILFSFSLFLAVLVFLQVPQLRRLPFYLSWWAYSFPLAALGVALILQARLTGEPGYRWAAVLVALALTAVVFLLVGLTVGAMRRRTICVEE